MLKLIALILLNLTSYAVYSDVTCKASPIDQGKYLNRKPPKSWTNCHGVYNYLNSISTYTGNFISGIPNGSGMLEYRMGTSYVGEWLDGEFNGSGMIKNSDGSSIDGHWERNSFTGYGIIILPAFGTLKGNWSKDIFTDVVSIQYTDGTEYTGRIYHGKYHGQGQFIYSDGTYYDGIWKEGIQHGKGKMIFPDKKELDGIWNNGQFVGSDHNN